MRRTFLSGWTFAEAMAVARVALAATPFGSPPEIVSGNGVLGGELTVAPATVANIQVVPLGCGSSARP